MDMNVFIMVYKRKRCELASLNILTVLEDICFPRVFIKRLATEIMSLLNHSGANRKECQLGGRKVISHSEIEFEPSSSGAHCSDKTSRTIRHTRLDSEELDPGRPLWRKKICTVRSEALVSLITFQSVWGRGGVQTTGSLELLLLIFPAGLVIDTCLLLPSTQALGTTVRQGREQM